MASTLNGIGTAYLGVSRPDDEGWRSATLCFVVFGLPILPLRRHVIRPTSYSDSDSISLEVAETGWPRLLDVLAVFFVRWCVHLPIAIAPGACLIYLFAVGAAGDGSFVGEYAGFLGLGALVWLAVYFIIVGEREARRFDQESFGWGFFCFYLIFVIGILAFAAISASRDGDHTRTGKVEVMEAVPEEFGEEPREEFGEEAGVSDLVE